MSDDKATSFPPNEEEVKRIQKFFELLFMPEDAIAIGSHDLPNERGRRYMNEHQAALNEMFNYQHESWRNNSDMFFAVLPMQPEEEQPRGNRRQRGQGIAQPGRVAWVDLDEGMNPDLRDELEDYGASIVLSGSKAGLLPKAHAYFHFTEALDPRESVWLSARLAKKWGGDKSCAEAARLLRIPGTYNHKTSPPRPVELLTVGQAWVVDEFYAEMGFTRPDVDTMAELEDTYQASKEQVADFTRRTALLAGSTSGPIKGYITKYSENTTPGVISDRHGQMFAMLNWAAREAQQGKVCFSDAVEALRQAWRLSLGPDKGRANGPEFDEMVQYAVGSLPSSPMDAEGQAPSEYMTDEMYAANNGLQIIRNAAHRHMISPDVLVVSTMARVASLLPPQTKLESTPGNDGTANFLAAVMGLAGAGKSQGNRVARKLVIAPMAVVKAGYISDRPLSTGEGVAESFYGLKEIEQFESQEDGEGKVKSRPKTSPKKERAVVRHNVHFSLDEGEVLIKNANVPTSTVTEVLRSAWTGGTLGQQNASHDKVRHVPAGSYALGFVASFQPSVFSDIFAQSGNGFPARFSYAAAGNLAPVMDEEGNRIEIEDLGILEETSNLLVELWSAPRNITYDEGVKSAILMEIYKSSKGSLLEAAPKSKKDIEDMQLRDLDAHRTYHWAKLAALLALLEGRTHVEPSDFALAKEMYEVQKIVRTMVLRIARATQRALDRAADSRKKDVNVESAVEAGIQLAAINKKDDDEHGQTLQRIVEKAITALATGKTAASIKSSQLSARERKLWPEAMEYGVETEQLVKNAKGTKYVLPEESN